MECGVQDPRTFFEEHAPSRLGEQVAAVLPDGVAVIFHVEGEGGGSWQVDTHEGQLRIGAMGEGLRDCEVWCSAADFMGILRGTINARRAFLRGRIQVVGDVGLALKLQGVLSEAR